MTAKFQTGSRFRWHEQTYEVRQLLRGSMLNIADTETSELKTVTHLELAKAHTAGDLSLEGENPNLIQREPVDWSDISEARRQVAEYRLMIITPFLELRRKERYAAIQASVENRRARCDDNTGTLLACVSVPSVYRWLRVYERSGRDIRALLPQTSRRGKIPKRLDESVERVIDASILDHAYLEEKRGVDYIHREVARRIKDENRQRLPEDRLAPPSRATLARRLNEHQHESQIINKRNSHKARRETTQYDSMDYPDMPLARVEIDHTVLDLMVLDDERGLPLGRPTLTFCIDSATRYPLGYYVGFELPSYLTVMQCLDHTIRPKPSAREQFGTKHDWLAHGVPYTLVVDNGKEFIGQDFEDACLLLGITVERSPARSPEYKATVERHFKTLNEGLIHTLPGTTFSNIDQRGDYDSAENACLTLSDLHRILHIFYLDIYAEDYHRGLKDIPARRWQACEDEGFFPRTVPGKDLLVLLGRVETRTLQHYGLEIWRMRYNSQDLLPLRLRLNRQSSRAVKIKYDPANLGRIHVFDPFEERYIEVPAVSGYREYAEGLSLWAHNVVLRNLRGNHIHPDPAALGEAQRRIQEIVQASLDKKSSQTHSREARWMGAVKNGTKSSSSGLENDSPASDTPTTDGGKVSNPLAGYESDSKELEWPVTTDFDGYPDFVDIEGQENFNEED